MPSRVNAGRIIEPRPLRPEPRYSGFKQLQSVFKRGLPLPPPDFGAYQRSRSELSRNKDHGSLGYLRDLVVRDMAALQDLLEGISEKTLAGTANCLCRLNDLHCRTTSIRTYRIIAQVSSDDAAPPYRPSRPCRRSGARMAATMTDRDVLIAIAFRHYAKEVVVISDVAVNNGTSIIAITTAIVTPRKRRPDSLHDSGGQYLFSRSLAAPMCLVQCIAMATAALLQPGRDSTPRIPTVTEMAHDRTAAQTRRQRHSSKL